MLIPNEVDYRLLSWARDCWARGAAGMAAIHRWLNSDTGELRFERYCRIVPYLTLALLIAGCQDVAPVRYVQMDCGGDCTLTLTVDGTSQSRGGQSTDVAREAEVGITEGL